MLDNATPSGFEFRHCPVILSENDREIVFSYSGMVDTVSQQDFAAASELKALDDEIAITRILIRRLLQNDPDNFNGLVRAIKLLVRMINVNRSLPHSRAG